MKASALRRRHAAQLTVGPLFEKISHGRFHSTRLPTELSVAEMDKMQLETALPAAFRHADATERAKKGLWFEV